MVAKITFLLLVGFAVVYSTATGFNVVDPGETSEHVHIIVGRSIKSFNLEDLAGRKIKNIKPLDNGAGALVEEDEDSAEPLGHGQGTLVEEDGDSSGQEIENIEPLGHGIGGLVGQGEDTDEQENEIDESLENVAGGQSQQEQDSQDIIETIIIGNEGTLNGK